MHSGRPSVTSNQSCLSLSSSSLTVAYEELLDDHKLEGDFFSLLLFEICMRYVCFGIF